MFLFISSAHIAQKYAHAFLNLLHHRRAGTHSLDAVQLQSGHWVLVYNDTSRGRASLAVSLSNDEGRTWKWTRHLERHTEGSYHYPAAIVGQDGTIHVVYSYFVPGGKSMKHAAFNEAWIRQGDAKE